MSIDHPALTVVLPGGGRAGNLSAALGVVFKLGGGDTGGALAMVEHPFAVGAVTLPHRHTREDEYSIVLEGQVGFRSGDREVVLGPGGYISKPRGETHAMWNAGAIPARIIEIISPAGFEGFFGELADLNDRGAPTREQVDRIAENYGLVFEEPEWFSGIVERYNLTVPQRH